MMEIFGSPNTPETEDEKFDCCINRRVSGCGTYFPGSDNCVPYRDNLRTTCPAKLDHTINTPIDANGWYLNTIVSGGRAPGDTPWISDQQCINWAKSFDWMTGVSITTPPDGRRLCLGHSGDVDYIYAPNGDSKAMIFGGRKTNCEAACTTTSATYPDPPSWCSDAVQYACRNNPLQPFCQEFCAKSGVNCDNLMTTFCASLGIETARNTKGCECFLPPAFYENWFSELTAKLNFPNPSTVDPVCTYPQCASATLRPFRAKGANKSICPDTFQCISATNINNDGTISGDIKISSDVKCSDITQKTNPSPTPSPTPKPTPTPVPTPTPTPPPPGPEKSFWTKLGDFIKKWWWAILLTILGISLILGLIAAASKKSQQAKVQAQVQAAAIARARSLGQLPGQFPFTAPSLPISPMPIPGQFQSLSPLTQPAVR